MVRVIRGAIGEARDPEEAGGAEVGTKAELGAGAGAALTGGAGSAGLKDATSKSSASVG